MTESSNFRYISYLTRTDPSTGRMTPSEGKRKVFISYKHSDEAALPLCKTLAETILKELDVAVWYDKELTAGEEYDSEIRHAITNSDAVVLLLTPHILESDYVMNQEIPFAKSKQIAVIPVIAGLSEQDIQQVEAHLGRVHMPVWFFEEQTTAPSFHADAKKQFFDGLTLCIANKDLLEQARQFYEKGAASVSVKYLTPEQMFLKAYGHLFQLISDGNKQTGVKLMESILKIGDFDEDFSTFQEQVSRELIKHLYRANEPDLFFPYLKSALAKGYGLFDLLFDVYRQQWHPDILCRETTLSFSLFQRLYQSEFQKPWDAGEFLRHAECTAVAMTDALSSDAPRIGELHFDGHTAFFQASQTDNSTIHLIVDSQKIASYDVYASCGDASFVYLAYDDTSGLLLTLYADFDHYGPETITKAVAYQIESHAIHSYSQSSEWLKGQRQLPYSPYTFRRMP